MKLIIAGSRTITNPEILSEAWSNHLDIPPVHEIVCGGAKGVDTLGYDWAKSQKMPIRMFPANWTLHGRSAGHIRNKEMADYADALLLVWDGKSKGSANMKANMETLNKPIYESIIK